MVLNTHQDLSEVQVLEMEAFLFLPCLPAGPFQVLPGRLTLQLTCFRNSLWRESSLALTRDKQAESITLLPQSMENCFLFPHLPRIVI